MKKLKNMGIEDNNVEIHLYNRELNNKFSRTGFNNFKQKEKAGGGGSGSNPSTGCAAMYGQCGGSRWTGAKCCLSGTCK